MAGPIERRPDELREFMGEAPVAGSRIWPPLRYVGEFKFVLSLGVRIYRRRANTAGARIP